MQCNWLWYILHYEHKNLLLWNFFKHLFKTKKQLVKAALSNKLNGKMVFTKSTVKSPPPYFLQAS